MLKKFVLFFATVLAMIAGFFILTKVFLYYADRPLDASAIPKTDKVQESKTVLGFIHATHESLNSFLNYGKSEKYTEADWQQLRNWFAQNEPGLKGIEKEVQNQTIKNDLKRSYDILKRGMDEQNITYVVLSHRIYHDLDILVNQYTGETNIWGVTEFGNGENVKQIEEIVKPKQ
jgi:hypothetical protein